MVRFISRHSNLRAVCKPTRIQIIDGRSVMEAGFGAQFLDGSYSTDDPKKIKMLREHPRYKYDFFEVPETPEPGLGADVVDGPHQPAAKPAKKKKAKGKK